MFSICHPRVVTNNNHKNYTRKKKKEKKNLEQQSASVQGVRKPKQTAPYRI
jgi:hypothetical protein